MSAIRAKGRIAHTRLRQHSRYRMCERRANYDDDLIKEKIELKPIQLVGLLGIRYDNRDYSVYSNVVNSCCIDLLVCRGADTRI